MVQSLFDRHRMWLAIGIALTTAAALFGISQLRLEDDLRGLLQGSADDFAMVDRVAERFGTHDRDCIVRADAHEGDILAPAAISELRRVCDELRKLEGIDEVHSLLDVRRTGMLGGLLTAVPRGYDQEDDPEVLTAVRARLESNPLIAGTLLSSDATSTIIQLRLAADVAEPRQLPHVLPGIEAVLDRYATTGPLSFELTGMPALRLEAVRSLRRDILLFNSIGVAVAVVLSAVAARSWRATLLACLPPMVGALWATGLLALFGVPINMLTCIVPSLAMVVGTCDSIHFIEDMRRSTRRGVDPRTASASAVGRVGAACGITSLVTAVGFLSLSVARIEAVRTFGLVAAAGAVASFLAVTALTPLMASDRLWRGAHLGQSPRRIRRFACGLTAWSLRHAWPVATVGLLGTAALLWACGDIQADNRIIDALPRGGSAAQTLAGIDRDFGGTMGVDVLVAWPDDFSWNAPEVTAVIEQVHAVLQPETAVSSPLSLASITSTLSPRAVRQLRPERLERFLDLPSRSAVVRTRVRDDGSRQLEAVFERIDKGLAAIHDARPGWTIDLVGVPVVSARNIRQLINDLASSLALEVFVIGGILAVAFRSSLAGIVSMVPNLFPLAAVAAVLTAAGGSLDPASVIVFNVCLGLSVDDTVHVFAAIKRQQREGVELASAIRRGMVETGTPIILGGMVLAVGFAGVIASSVPSLSRFGLLASSAAVTATFAELVLLPATLIAASRLVNHVRNQPHRGSNQLLVGSEGDPDPQPAFGPCCRDNRHDIGQQPSLKQRPGDFHTTVGPTEPHGDDRTVRLG